MNFIEERIEKKIGSFWHLAQLISAPSYDKGIDWKRATVVDTNCFIEKWFCKDVTLVPTLNEQTDGRTDGRKNKWQEIKHKVYRTR